MAVRIPLYPTLSRPFSRNAARHIWRRREGVASGLCALCGLHQAHGHAQGTLKVVPAVKTIGACAFANSELTSLDLMEATALVDIGDRAFYATPLAGTLVIPVKVTTIGDDAFAYTKLTGLDLSKATSLVEIWEGAFLGTNLAGTLVIPATVTTIDAHAFAYTKLTGFDFSKATALGEIGRWAFSADSSMFRNSVRK